MNCVRKLSDINSNWKEECKQEVETLLLQDKTTTKENLREKAINYIRNYIAENPNIKSVDKEGIAEDIADEIEEELKDTCFGKKPLASEVAQKKRDSLKDAPENKFIKLR